MSSKRLRDCQDTLNRQTDKYPQSHKTRTLFGTIFSSSATVAPMTNTPKTHVHTGVTDEALFVSARQRQDPVPIHVKILNGFGSVPGQHKDFAFNTLLLLYYSQILGLSASWASLALGVSLVVDAVSDPLVGGWSDNFRSRFGRRHLFMLAAILPTSLSFYALFHPPTALADAALAAWMLTFTILARLSFTFFAVPWAAMSIELSHRYEERTSIQTYRVAVGWFVGAVFTFLMYALVFPPTENDPSGLLNPDSYAPFGTLVSVLIASWMLITTLTTLNQIPYLARPSETLPRVRLTALISQTISALRNRNFRMVFLAALTTAAIAGTGLVFDVYMNLYFWEFSSEDIKWFIFAAVGAAAAFAVIAPLQRRFEKQQIVIAAVALIMLLGMTKVGFRFAGIWPDNGQPLLLPLLVLHMAVMSFAGAIAIIMYAAIIPDIVDENEHRTGLRQEGMFSAGIAFAGKSTTGLGLFVGGLLLEWVVAFPVQTQPQTLDPDLIVRLGVVDGILVPAFSIIPILLLRQYQLNRVQLETIQGEVRERKQRAANTRRGQEA